MQCGQCGFEPPAGSKFCGRCGSPVPVICPACSFESPAGFKFCGECGAQIGDAPTSPAISVEPERRQLTVMFCDLVDSTTLAGELDPEELRDLTRAYQSTASEVFDRYGGHIAQYLGDGLLVYFGYPQAHEDDARRAVLAGLGMLAGMQQLNERLERDKGLRLAVRIGIHTGPVVTGEIGAGERRERLALGQTPNVAARLQGMADPDQVVMSLATHQLVQGLFACRPLGPKALKGLQEPLEVFQVLKESGVQSRFEVAASHGLHSLVGREDEMEMLAGGLRAACEGRLQVVLLSGEAGIGKSRLIEELRRSVVDRAGSFLIFRASPYHQDSAFQPLIGPLMAQFSFVSTDTAKQRLAKLEQGLGRLPVALDEAVPLVAGLFSLPLGERYAPLGATPRQQKKQLFETLLVMFLDLARAGPLVLVIEDLHWIDPSTREFLDLLIERRPAAPIFAVLSFRPSFEAPWDATHIRLQKLPDAQIQAMIDEVTGGRRLPSEVQRQVIERTDGVPLFVEELTKMVTESGLVRENDGAFELTGPLPPLAIPMTLQDSLAARLDRPSATKHVAQIGSVLGRDFTYEAICRVGELPEARLRADLARLVEAELLLQSGEPPRSAYSFKHVLIQEVAYNSLLKRQRRVVHGRIAELLLEDYPELAETRPEIPARHYTAAGLGEKAIGFWLKAGRQAIERSANLEAIGHLRRGLEVHGELPADRRDPRLELDLQTTVAGAYTSIRGWTAAEVKRAYARAQQLCEQIGDTPQIFWVLRGLWSFHAMGGDWHQALEFGHRLMRLATSQTEPAYRIEAHHAVGLPLFFLGEPGKALEQIDRGLSLDSAERDRSLTFTTGIDVVVTSKAISGVVAWHVGQPEQATGRCRAGLELARELGHAFSLADAMSSAVWLQNLLGDGAEVEKLAAELLALSEAKGFHYTAFSNILLGWARVAVHGDAESIDRIHRGLSAYRAIGARVGEVYFLFLLAESYLRLARLDEAAEVLDEADDLVAGVEGRHYWKPELDRLRGEVLMAAGKGREAAGPLRAALELARRQGSSGLELRAATSLGRLHREQGEDQGARSVLEPVYASFSEGFDTADLSAARRLLDSLS